MPSSDATAGLEQPAFFESAGRPLYSVFHPAARPGAPVVVHVHGYGVEQMALYRAEVQMARTAAAAGFPVLRVHLRGHGDSSGDFADVTLDGMVEDAMASADEAKRRSGTATVVWLGVRIGGLVAAEAMGRRSDAAGLALFNFPLLIVWDQAASVLGLPLLPVALFAAWAGLIAALALASERGHRDGDGDGDEGGGR